MRLFAGLMMVLVGLAAQAQAQAFKVATLSPDGSFWTQEIKKATDSIAAQTDGRVTFKIYAGGVMGSDEAVLRKIRIGQLQGGAVTTGSILGVYGDAAIYGMPFKFQNFDEIDAVRAKMDAEILKKIEQGGLVPFGLSEGGFAYVMSKQPIKSVADLQQAKVWAPSNDELSIGTLKELGVTPVTLGLGDVLTSLQTGIIDTVATSPVAALALQWHTGVQYITELPVVYFSGVMVMDPKALAKASEADQNVIRTELSKAFHILDKRNRDDNVAAMEALKNQGIQVVTPSAEDLPKWYAIRDIAYDVNKRIHMFTDAALDTLDGHLQAYRVAHPQDK